MVPRTRRCRWLTLVLYGTCTAAAQAMPMAPPADLGSGTSFEQAAAPPARPPLTPEQAQRVDEPGPAALLALGLSVLALARRQRRR